MSLQFELAHRLGDFQLDVALDAPRGVTALFGPSGSGKTSLVNAIAGLLRPDQGRVVLDGRVLLDTEANIFVPPHQRRIGYVFQDARLFPHLSVRDNVTYGLRFAARTLPIEPVVDLLGLGGLLGRMPARLSGGETQRVALGRALLSDPQMLLMDEPLAALDTARKDEILPYLERLRDEAGLPILYVSHAMVEVARLATTLVLLRDGRITRAGPVAEVLSDPEAVRDLGVRDAGAILEATVQKRDAGDGLSVLASSAGHLFLPMVDLPEGALVRVRIQASDVILSKERPEGLSALNVLPATIKTLHEGAGPGVAVALMSGEDRLIARITRRSAKALELREGSRCFAVIKTVSVAPVDVGGQIAPEVG
ncbi:MAG: molybdenum ABC transporter ATP-binding protein [Litoreibacter sp.]|nr:molybdenum ABC transporter ATP-binding protein [Litoreibacter sp.]